MGAEMIIGEITLTPSVEMTIVECPGCTPKSRVFLQEQTDGAVNAQAYVDPEDIGEDQFTIWHNAVSQATFTFMVVEG